MALFVLFKQKTAYELRISDWSSDVCSSDLLDDGQAGHGQSFDLPIIMAMRPAPGQGRSAENGLARPRASSQQDERGADRQPDDEVERNPDPPEIGKAIIARRIDQRIGLIADRRGEAGRRDRKGTRLNSSH